VVPYINAGDVDPMRYNSASNVFNSSRNLKHLALVAPIVLHQIFQLIATHHMMFQKRIMLSAVAPVSG
jgi:hypothetical protein